MSRCGKAATVSSNGRECILAGAERGPAGGTTPSRCRLQGAYAVVRVWLRHAGKGGHVERRQEVRITPAGRVEVTLAMWTSARGSTTVLAQMAAEALEMPVHLVDMVMADTATTHQPPSPPGRARRSPVVRRSNSPLRMPNAIW